LAGAILPLLFLLRLVAWLPLVVADHLDFVERINRFVRFGLPALTLTLLLVATSSRRFMTRCLGELTVALIGEVMGFCLCPLQGSRLVAEHALARAFDAFAHLFDSLGGVPGS